MKKLIVLILISLVICTSCSKAKQDVELFNTQTESTISLYESTLNVAKDSEQELVCGLLHDDITLPHKDNFDYKDAHDLLQANKNDMIEELVVVNSTNFYTRLGINSVTQVTDFLFQGTHYVMQVLWVDSKMDMLILEVA